MFAAAQDPSVMDKLADAIPLVVTGFFTLGGVVVGQWMTHRAATRAWRRDRMVDTYGRFAGAAHATWLANGKLWANDNTELWPELVSAWRTRATELARVGSEIDILGPDEVADAAEAVSESHHRLGMRIDPDLPLPESIRRQTSIATSPEGLDAQAALVAFVKAARRAVS